MTGSICSSVLHTHDLSRIRAFYERLFGWAFDERADAPDSWVITSAGRVVAHARVTTDVATAWVPQVAVDDVAACLRHAVSLGAGIVSHADDLGGVRMARLRDLEGAEFGVCTRRGDEPGVATDMLGALWWMEVLSLDAERATRFYGDLFGWQSRTTAFAPFDRYVVFEREGRQEGGGLPMDPDWGVAPRWNTIIAVEDADQASTRAVALGGCVHHIHTVPSAGRIAVLGDPEGTIIVVRGRVPEQATSAVPGIPPAGR